MVRLAGGDFVNEGRVEVYCNGVWGTVCNSNVDIDDRRAICRQLGYNEAFFDSNLIIRWVLLISLKLHAYSALYLIFLLAIFWVFI